jgi:predicted ribosome quality control (RQC) complex YloA/Tae2 family protein
MKTETFENESGEWEIIIGRNKDENWKLIDDASPNDIWFHVTDMPSCHVILKTDKNLRNIEKDVLKRCALLCKMNSKAKTLNKCSIMYTEIENIKKTKNVGEVIAKKYKEIII